MRSNGGWKKYNIIKKMKNENDKTRLVSYLYLKMKENELPKLCLYFWFWKCQTLMIFAEVENIEESFGR